MTHYNGPINKTVKLKFCLLLRELNQSTIEMGFLIALEQECLSYKEKNNGKTKKFHSTKEKNNTYLNWWILSIAWMLDVCWSWTNNSQIVDETWTQRLSLLFGHFQFLVLKLCFEIWLICKEWDKKRLNFKCIQWKPFEYDVVASLNFDARMALMLKKQTNDFCVTSRSSGR